MTPTRIAPVDFPRSSSSFTPSSFASFRASSLISSSLNAAFVVGSDVSVASEEDSCFPEKSDAEDAATVSEVLGSVCLIIDYSNGIISAHESVCEEL